MKKLFVLILGVIFLFSGCTKNKQVIKEDRVAWGTKEEICTFINGPTSLAERWTVVAQEK